MKTRPMNIGLIAVDRTYYPNFALMRIASYHKSKGDYVEWASPLFGQYDKIYKSKIFTFTEDDNFYYDCPEIINGGTGYEVKSHLPEDIEAHNGLDYSIYPSCDFSVQFFSRGCIRKCPFCLVHDKEGYIHPVEPMNLNPNGKHIEVLDNNFFANPEWRSAIEYLLKTGQKVNLHGVDIRIMNEEQAYYLNKIKLKSKIHIAWDLPEIDLTDKLKEVVKYIKPSKLMCYVLIGYNSTIEQDLYRVLSLQYLGITPFVQPYRDFENKRMPTQYEKDFARWVNKQWIFESCDFADFEPRKGFKCKEYFKNREI